MENRRFDKRREYRNRWAANFRGVIVRTVEALRALGLSGNMEACRKAGELCGERAYMTAHYNTEWEDGGQGYGDIVDALFAEVESWTMTREELWLECLEKIEEVMKEAGVEFADGRWGGYGPTTW